MIKQNQTYAIHTDHLNTPRVITDATAQSVWAWPNIEAFGDTPADEDPNNSGNLFTYNLRYPGQLYDTETKTHYNYYRDNYSPDIGRYKQSDPIGLAGGINTYGYVKGSPLKFVDETGLRRSIRWPTSSSINPLNNPDFHPAMSELPDASDPNSCPNIIFGCPFNGWPASPPKPNSNCTLRCPSSNQCDAYPLSGTPALGQGAGCVWDCRPSLSNPQ